MRETKWKEILKIKNRFTREELEKFLQILYLIVFALFIGYHFIEEATTFEIIWRSSLIEYLFPCLSAIVVVRLVQSSTYKGNELLLMFFLLFCCLMSWRESGHIQVLYFLVLLIGARGIDDSKIIKTYFATIFSLLMVTVFCAITGKIENLVYHQEGRNIRMALGSPYPTIFAAQILYLMLCWAYIRREKIKYIDGILSFICAGIVYILCEARMNAVCLALLGIGIFVYVFYSRHVKSIRKKFLEVWTTFLAISPAICFIGIFTLTALYSSDSSILLKLNSLLSSRLGLGNIGLKTYGISWWGQYVPMIGNGGQTEKPLNYFYLDSAYINYLLTLGIAILMMLLIVMVVLGFRAKNNKNWMFLWIMSIIALHGVVEDHILRITTNPFLWLLFSKMNPKENRYEKK
ncbi:MULTISPECIES: hypothetical protein [Clostridia]|uniref:hypothetical protein n=1 Tax=Clostridia TaxID=186801 RepID=UPI002A7F174A|nr:MULTISPECIES: hypothetical protein [Clostridia]MDY4597066.1 hypothetical protein [Faecalimonas umbilicata]MDY6232184.1 hypothetical protein [Peptostreptococcus porci]